MNLHDCVIRDLADTLERNPSIKAVTFDLPARRISFAYQPGSRNPTSERELEKTIHDRNRTCLNDPGLWEQQCDACNANPGRHMPPGLKLAILPGKGFMIQRETCKTAETFWKWSALPWPVFKTRHIPTAGELAELPEWKRALAAAILCGVAMISGWVASATAWPYAPLLFLLAYIAGGWFPAIETYELLRKRELDVHFLMLCVAVGAALIGQWGEGSILLFLFSLSGALEDMALHRTEREIQSLFKEAPRDAVVIGPDGNEHTVPVDDIVAGMKLRILPGDRIPVDAVVEDGASAMDESTLTGESIPVDKHPGDPVYSGTLNLWGRMSCRALKPVAESALSRIITLIREAQESKAPSQRFTDHFGTRYTYIILGLCILMFLVWGFIGSIPWFLSEPGNASAFYRAMTLLVVSSPCALVLSIPSAILCGIAAGARRGILFRGGAAIEDFARIDRIALDKTGTLTTGEMKIESTEATGDVPEQAGRIIASIAVHSTHPVAKAIRSLHDRAAQPLYDVQGFKLLSGAGMEARVMYGNAAIPVRIGKRALFPEHPWIQQCPAPAPGHSETFAVFENRSAMRIMLQDAIRTSSAPLLRHMKQKGVKLTMLTGDQAEAAAVVARDVGDIDFRAGLKPEDKVEAIRGWRVDGEKVAMVGDGINDAPSLAAADIAVGMGLRGSDTVLELSDIVLMKDRLEALVDAHDISLNARRIIRQNLIISLGVIVLMAGSAALSLIPLTMGVIAHEGSTVIVVFNSLRLLLRKRHRQDAGQTSSMPPSPLVPSMPGN